MKLNKKMAMATATLGVLLFLGACGKTEEKKGEIVGGSVEEAVYSNDSTDDVVGIETLKKDGFFKDIVTKGIDPEVKSIISYDTDYTNSDWDHIKFDVDHAKIVTVDHYKDTENHAYKTLLSLKYELNNENSKDKNITPDNAEIVLSDGKKIKAEIFMDTWDDEFLTTDKHKDGYIHFKIKNNIKLKNIKSINITFKSDNDSYKEMKHTYKIDFPIEPEE